MWRLRRALVMVMDSSPRYLDDLDISLIRVLDADARQSYIQLAEKLPASRNTVRRRLQRLLDEKTIRFVTLTSPLALGYRTQATIAMTVHPGNADAVAEKLASLANIRHVLITTGRYDLVAAAIFRDLEDMLDFLTGELGSVPNLLSTEVMIGVKWMKNCLNRLTASDHVFPAGSGSHVLDELDVAIIRELETDPVQANLDLVTKLGISRPTLRKRMKALLDNGIIRIGTVVSPLVVGCPVMAVLLIRTRTSEIKTVAERLTDFTEIANLSITAGTYEMTASAAFRDSNHMSEFIKNKVGSIAGVKRIEAMIMLDVKKLSFNVLNLGLEPA